MDHAVRLGPRALVRRAQSRVLALSRDAESRWRGLTLLSGVVGRRALTASLLVGGLCLATLAYDATARETLLSWKRHNLPSPAVWKYAMGAQGFRELTEGPLFQKTLKTLPAQTDTAGQVWVSKATAWLAVFHAGGTVPISLFCHSCQGKPGAWIPLEELGWEALSPAMAEAQRLAKLEAPRQVKREAPRDPREVRY